MRLNPCTYRATQADPVCMQYVLFFRNQIDKNDNRHRTAYVSGSECLQHIPNRLDKLLDAHRQRHAGLSVYESKINASHTYECDRSNTIGTIISI